MGITYAPRRPLAPIKLASIRLIGRSAQRQIYIYDVMGVGFDSDRSSLGLLFYCSQQGKIVAYPHQFHKTVRDNHTTNEC